MQAKKNYRSLIRLVSLVFVFTFAMTVSAFAASLEVADVSGYPGEQVVVSVSLQGSGGAEIAGAQFDVSFNQAQLEYQSTAVGNAADAAEKSLYASEVGANTIRCMLLGVNRNVINDGELALLSFTIKDTATAGAYDVSLNDIIVSNLDAQAVSVGHNDGSVTVENEPTEPLAINPATLSIAKGSSKTAAVTGGVPPYTVSSSDDAIAMAAPGHLTGPGTVTVTGLEAGSATITVSDSNSHSVVLQVVITDSNACEPAVLTDELALQVPQIHYQTLFGVFGLWVDFELFPVNDDSLVFRVTDFGILDNFQPDSSCQAAMLSENLDLHLPMINYQTLFGDIQLWVGFEYRPDQDHLLFEVVDFGIIN